MKFFAAVAVMLAVAGSISGCVDAKVDIAVTGPGTARVIGTQTMEAVFYAMIKSDSTTGQPRRGEFCFEGALTEHDDGSATCTRTKAGAFATLDLGQGEGEVIFTPAGPGLVRVSLPTGSLRAKFGPPGRLDEQGRQMFEDIFADHSIAIAISGAEIVDTNLTPASGNTAAATEIFFLDIIAGTADLPEDLFAVVRVP